MINMFDNSLIYNYKIQKANSEKLKGGPQLNESKCSECPIVRY